MEPQDPEFDTLIESHLAYARSVAFRIHQRLPSHIEFKELVARAYLGLVQAARGYDPSQGKPFIAYAKHRIEGEVREATRRKHLQHASTSQLSCDPEAANAITALQTIGTIPEDIDRAGRLKLLLEAIEELDPESQVILRQLCADLSARECARRLGISIGMVGQRRHRAYQQLRRSNAGKRLKEIMGNQAPQTVPIDQQRRVQVIDELGDIERRLTVAKVWADLKRIDVLRDEIRTWIPADYEASKEAIFEGKKFTAKVLPKRDERSVKPGGYKKILTWLNDLFFDHCHMTIKTLEVLLTADQQAEVLEKGPTGARWVRTESISKPKSRAA